VFKHGFELQALTFCVQPVPIQPAEHLQVYEPGVFVHEPLPHGLCKHSLMSTEQLTPCHPALQVQEYSVFGSSAHEPCTQGWKEHQSIAFEQLEDKFSYMAKRNVVLGYIEKQITLNR
jgi:hypothetical protein